MGGEHANHNYVTLFCIVSKGERQIGVGIQGICTIKSV
jgi:hypothetical protein